MANNLVANVVGTQQQFRRQPDNLYQKRLITPSAGGNYAVGAEQGALRLASALGVLGSGLLAESIAREQRREKLGVSEADRIFRVASEEDKEKLATLDMLGRAEKFELADNPYAVARIDEMRGQHLATKLTNEYETEVLPNQPLAKTSQENIKNYEDFMHKRISEETVAPVNTTAFEKGFYGSRTKDVLSQDLKYRQLRQADYEAERNALIASTADDIVTNSLNAAPEALAQQVQEKILNSQMLTSFSKDQRIKAMDAILKGITTNGNPEQLKALGELVLYFKEGDETQPIKVKDVCAMGDYDRTATKMLAYYNEKESREFLSALDGKTPEGIVDAFEKLKQEKPHLWEVLSPKMDSIITRRKQEIERKRQAELKAQLAKQEQAFVSQSLNAKYQAYLNGQATDAYGNMALNKTYMGIDGKQHTYTDNDIIQFGYNQLERIKQSLPKEEQAAAMLKLFAFPNMGAFVEAQKMYYSQGLNNVQEGDQQFNDNVNYVLEAYRADEGNFRSVFGDKITDEVALINSDIDTRGVPQAITRFANKRTVLKDPDARKTIQTAWDNNFSGIDVELKTLGDISAENVPLLYNVEMKQQLKASFEDAMANGYSEADAVTFAKEQAKKYFVVYRGCAIPRTFFDTLPEGTPVKLIEGFVDAKLSESNPSANVHTKLIYRNNQLVIMRNGIVTDNQWTKTAFVKSLRDWEASLSDSQRRVYAEDVYAEEQASPEYYLANPDARTIEEAEKLTGYHLSFEGD